MQGRQVAKVFDPFSLDRKFTAVVSSDLGDVNLSYMLCTHSERNQPIDADGFSSSEVRPSAQHDPLLQPDLQRRSKPGQS